MNVRNYYDLLRGKTTASNPAKLTLSNIKGFLQALYRKGREISGFKLPSHVYEQIIWRRTEVARVSPECWESNSCKVCGCDVLGKTMEDRSCEGFCYPEMMGEGEWDKYKKMNNINLFK